MPMTDVVLKLTGKKLFHSIYVLLYIIDRIRATQISLLNPYYSPLNSY